MSKVIVSGGAGFIGSNFIRLAINNNWYDEIVVIDKLTYSSNKAFIPKNEKIKSYFCDISETPIEELLNSDYYFNFAAETHVDKSINDSLVFTESNILSLHKLIERIRISDSDIKFVHISTDEVYGSIAQGSFDENAKLNPKNPYSATKAAAEHILLSYFNTYDIDIKITRSSNQYGIHQYKEKLIPKIILNFLNQKPIGVYGDGTQIRDWTHVEDNCYGIHLSSTKCNPGEVVNISANDERMNIDIVNLIAKLMDVNFEFIKYVKDRPGHDFRYSINTDRIRSFGWKPLINLETGFQKTIEWYKNYYKN